MAEDWRREDGILPRKSKWRENSIDYRPVSLKSSPGAVVKWTTEV